MKLVLLWLTLHSLGPAAPSALRMIFGLLPTAKRPSQPAWAMQSNASQLCVITNQDQASRPRKLPLTLACKEGPFQCPSCGLALPAARLAGPSHSLAYDTRWPLTRTDWQAFESWQIPGTLLQAGHKQLYQAAHAGRLVWAGLAQHGAHVEEAQRLLNDCCPCRGRQPVGQTWQWDSLMSVQRGWA